MQDAGVLEEVAPDNEHEPGDPLVEDEEPKAPHPLPPAGPDRVCFTMPVLFSEFPTNSDANNTRLVSQFPMQNVFSGRFHQACPSSNSKVLGLPYPDGSYAFALVRSRYRAKYPSKCVK